MEQSSARHSPRFGSLNGLLDRLRSRPVHTGLRKKRRFRPQLERLEDRTLLSVDLISNFTGMNQVGASGPTNNPGFIWLYVPPDTCGAAGPTSYVETANQAITIFTPKATGTTSVTDSADDFWFTQGGLTKVTPLPTGTTHPLDNLSDISVVWDDLAQRFIIGDQDVKGNTSNFEIAVSKTASPATLTSADWYFYQVNTSESNRSADYPGNLGYNRDALVFTLNENSTASGTNSDVQVTSIKMSDLIAGNPITPFQNDYAPVSTTSAGQFTLRPTVMHDSAAGDPMWLVYSSIGGGSTINVVKMTNVLSNSAGFNNTSLNVNSYSSVVQPLQPNGTTITPASGNGADWTHIFKAAEYNNTIVAADNVSVSSTQDDARWYTIDVSSGTPTLKDQGDVSAGNNKYIVYPSVDINANGDIGMNYLESGGTNPANPNSTSNEFMSMYVTGRRASDAAGTMETPVLVQAGSVNNTDGREGDLSGINVDSTPLTVTAAANQTATEGTSASLSLGSFTDSEGNFWAANEFAATGGSWGTSVGQFSLGVKGPWKVDVSWGDSTPDSIFNVSTLGSLGTLNHTFGEEGTYTVTVKVTDTADNHSDSKSYTVSVSDPAVLGSGVAVNAVEGAAFTGAAVATFTDPGGAEPNSSDPSGTINDHYKVVSIDWGDSTPLDTSTGAISLLGSTFTVSGNHTYGEEGTYNITAIIDHEGVDTTVKTTASVSDPAIIATAVPVFGVECRTLTVSTATFTDPGGAEPNTSDPSGTIADHYKVDSIDWGDGTPLDTTTGTIAYGGAQGSTTNPFTVSGSHAYQHEGTYTITTILDHEGIITVTKTTAVIKDDLGLLLLDPTGSQSLMVTGNGSVTANGCGAVVVDSSDPSDAAFVSGNGTVTAEDIDVTGGVMTVGHGSFSAPIDPEAATPDPLGLTLPAPPTPTFGAVQYSGKASITLQPGTYVGGIAISGQASVTLAPGVYYMQGGGFSVSGQASVSGTGVTIINAPARPTDTIRVSGQATLNLTAPTSGPFQGVTIFQDPSSNNPVRFTGQAVVALTGVVYVPDALVSIDGNANVTINPGAGTAVAPPPILGALIAYDLRVTGNGVLTINPDDPPSGPSSAPMLAAPTNGPPASNPFSRLGTPSSGSAADNSGFSLQLALLLNGGQPVPGNDPSPSSALQSTANTDSANQSIQNPLYSGNLGGGVVSSAATKRAHRQSAITTSTELWNLP